MNVSPHATEYRTTPEGLPALGGFFLSQGLQGRSEPETGLLPSEGDGHVAKDGVQVSGRLDDLLGRVAHPSTFAFHSPCAFSQQSGSPFGISASEPSASSQVKPQWPQ